MLNVRLAQVQWSTRVYRLNQLERARLLQYQPSPGGVELSYGGECPAKILKDAVAEHRQTHSRELIGMASSRLVESSL